MAALDSFKNLCKRVILIFVKCKFFFVFVIKFINILYKITDFLYKIFFVGFVCGLFFVGYKVWCNLSYFKGIINQVQYNINSVSKTIGDNVKKLGNVVDSSKKVVENTNKVMQQTTKVSNKAGKLLKKIKF